VRHETCDEDVALLGLGRWRNKQRRMLVWRSALAEADDVALASRSRCCGWCSGLDGAAVDVANDVLEEVNAAVRDGSHAINEDVDVHGKCGNWTLLPLSKLLAVALFTCTLHNQNLLRSGQPVWLPGPK